MSLQKYHRHHLQNKLKCQYASVKRKVLILDLKIESLFNIRISIGREFHKVEEAELKALPPKVY